MSTLRTGYGGTQNWPPRPSGEVGPQSPAATIGIEKFVEVKWLTILPYFMPVCMCNIVVKTHTEVREYDLRKRFVAQRWRENWRPRIENCVSVWVYMCSYDAFVRFSLSQFTHKKKNNNKIVLKNKQCK